MSQIVLREDTSLILRSRDSLRACLKMILFSVTLVSYFLSTAPLLVVQKFYPHQTKKWLLRVIGSYAKFCLWFMDIKIEAPKTDQLPHGLFVCNHLSYLDVLVLAAIRPACFVTSVEIKHTPVLGQICQLAGCLFVERRSRENLSEEIKELTDALKNDVPVLIFPEGTSTNGEELLRFRRPLFQASIDAQVPVISLVLNYTGINGKRVGRMNRDFICWYGDMAFLPHLWSFFQCQNISAKVELATILNSDNVEDLSVDSHKAVQMKFSPLL